MNALVATEIRRALARRAVRLLIGIALVGIALAGVLVYVHATDPPTGFRLVQTWDGTDDAFLLTPGLLLVIGALIGGATVTGAEWRAGTVLGLLTWEPRRHRVLAARALAVGVLAAAISLILLILVRARAAAGCLPGLDRRRRRRVDRRSGPRDAENQRSDRWCRPRRGVHRIDRSQHRRGPRRGIRLPRGGREPDPWGAARVGALGTHRDDRQRCPRPPAGRTPGTTPTAR